MRYSLKYAILFSMYSAFIAYVMSSYGKKIGVAESWDFMWIYFGIATFIATYTLSYFFIEKKVNYRKTRLFFLAILIGILSHWLCHYVILVIEFVKALFNGLPLDSIINPINGIAAAAVYSILGLLFIGWFTMPVCIALSLLLKKKDDISKIENKIKGKKINNIC